jgi:hypothetical protein
MDRLDPFFNLQVCGKGLVQSYHNQSLKAWVQMFKKGKVNI